MNKEEFESKILVADRDLRKQGFSVDQRAHKMFDVLSPNSSFLFLSEWERRRVPETEYSGQDLYDKIQSWYIVHYGDRSQMYIRLRTIPVILLDDVYFFRIPLVYGTQAVKPLELIDGFTPLTASLLSEAEISRCIEMFQEGYRLSLSIDNMHTCLRGSNSSSRAGSDPFIVSAARDREIATRSLTSPYDCNNSIFHSQQFAEKILKSLLFIVEGLDEDKIRSKYGHKITKLWTRAKTGRHGCDGIDGSIRTVSQIDMSVRYSFEDRSIEDAVKIFWDALRIAAFCAREIKNGHQNTAR